MTHWLACGCLGILVAASGGCGVFGPSCIDEQGTILTTSGSVANEVATTTVRSPKSSNLVIRLNWEPGDARLGLRATITDCGGHVGCTMLTSSPSASPGGPGPGPHFWPSGYVEMLVDGWAGKTYRIEIVGVPDREMTYHLQVRYRIDCES